MAFKSKGSSDLKPHELAPHIAAMLRRLPATDMSPVEYAMQLAIELLQTVKPCELDMTVPDYGIVYSLMFERESHNEPVKAAATLLRTCLHAKERGCTLSNEHVEIPLLLNALSGFFPDHQKKISQKSRPNRSKLDALDEGIEVALRAHPESNWKEIAQFLQSANEALITSWELGGDIKFTDSAGESKSVSENTFRNRITKAKKRRTPVRKVR